MKQLLQQKLWLQLRDLTQILTNVWHLCESDLGDSPSVTGNPPDADPG